MSLGTGFLCLAFEESLGQPHSFFPLEMVGINKTRTLLPLVPMILEVPNMNDVMHGGLFFVFFLSSVKSQLCFLCNLGKVRRKCEAP